MVDLLIAGAGPAGAALAILTAARGHDVLLVDRADFPRDKLCGEFLSPEAFFHLRALGVERRVLAEGAIIDRLRFAVDGAKPLVRPLPRPALGLRRFVLDDLLVGAARERGAAWRPGTRVVAAEIETSPSGSRDPRFRAELLAQGDRSRLAARAVVNAGGRSGGLRPRSPDVPTAVAFRRHYRRRDGGEETRERSIELYPIPGGYAGLGPVDGGRVNLCALYTLDRFRSEGVRAEDFLPRAGAANSWLGRTLESLEPADDDLATTAGIPLVPGGPGPGPLLEIGDAAGTVAPLVGDGMSMALRSAELAAVRLHEYLTGTATWESSLARYALDWRREFDRRVRLAQRLERIVRSPRGARTLARIARGVPPLTSWLIRRTRDWDRATVGRT